MVAVTKSPVYNKFAVKNDEIRLNKNIIIRLNKKKEFRLNKIPMVKIGGNL